MWTIDFHRKAIEELRDMPDTLRDKLNTLFSKIEEDGFVNLSKNNIKYIDDGIMEFRVRGQDGIARSLYATTAGQTIDILLVFVKKTEKTPHKHIELAQKRREEMKNERNSPVGRN